MGTLRQEREARFLTLEDLASKAEITKNTLIRAENGGVVSRKTAKAIARVFGLLPNQLDGLNYEGRRDVSVAHVQPGNS